jgi:hypothetical protein
MSNVYEIENPNVNIDLINDMKMISPESAEGKEFHEFMTGVLNRMLENSPEQKKLLDECNFIFCLRDTEDKSPARIVDADYPMSGALNGNNFVVAFSIEPLSKMSSEDEIAHVLGHEISHIMYMKDENKLRDLHDNEEAACDLNSMKMLKNAGYCPDAAMDALSADNMQSTEINMRREECKKFAMQNFSDVSKTPYDTNRFKDIKFAPSALKYDFPSISDSEEVQQDRILKNLEKVYKYGDRKGFSSKMKGFMEELGSEKASKLVVGMVARATDEFPAIDEDKDNKDYGVHLRHPIAVFSDSVWDVGGMEGKKLYPPKSLAKVNKYISDNQSYFKGMEFVWDRVFKPQMNSNGMQGGRS